jgi:hypothetical protein
MAKAGERAGQDRVDDDRGCGMKAVILGAGSTIGTFGRSLGVDGFVSRLYEVRGIAWRKDYPDLARAIADCGSCNLDRVWTHVDYTAKLRRSLCERTDCQKKPDCTSPGCKGPDYGPHLSGQLRKALIDAYALNDEIDTLRMDADFTLKTVLASLGEGDALISFNWDTAAEQIASRLSIPKLLAAGRPPLAKPRVHLIKPHGSLSWEDAGIGDVKWRDEASGDPLLDPMVNDAHSGYPQPFVLGAVPIKDELLGQTQPNQSIYTVIADQWAAVVDAVARASEITVVGYGFPPEDGYGRFLFRQAARRRGTSMPRISYYALAKDTGKIEEALRDIFGKDVKYSFEGPVVSPRVH